MMAMVQTQGGAPAGMLGKLRAGVVIVLSLLYTGLVLGSGSDRLTATRPELANHVPSLFASEALRIAGSQALANGDVRATLAIAKGALRDAPADPQNAAMLGAGLLASGYRAQADQAFLVAGRLGWRVPITQSYWLGKALAVGDYEVAALRLDALLRQQPDLLSQRQLLDPMERNPAGRAALVRRMALRPEWLLPYVSVDASRPADVMMQRSDVLEEAARQGLVLGCGPIAPTIARLIELNLHDEAGRLSKAHCRAQEPKPISAKCSDDGHHQIGRACDVSGGGTP